MEARNNNAPPANNTSPNHKESGDGAKGKSGKKGQAALNRPAMQIYRPPGSRKSAEGSPPPDKTEKADKAEKADKGARKPVVSSNPPRKTRKEENGHHPHPQTHPPTTPEAKRSGKGRRGENGSGHQTPPNQPANQTSPPSHPSPPSAPPAPPPITPVAIAPPAPTPQPTLALEKKGPVPLFPAVNGNTPPPAKTPPRRLQSPGPTTTTANNSAGTNTTPSDTPRPRLPPRRQNSFIKASYRTLKVDQSALNQAKSKPSGPKDIEELRRMFAALDLPHSTFLNQYLDGGLESVDLAAPTAQLLVQAAIEEGRSSKAVGKLCGALVESASGPAFHAGLVAACWQYYECRDKLRSEHFKFWLAFLAFAADLYGALGFAKAGELVDILFRIFDFMLTPPVLEALKIEELECLISGLMGTGYELERECPERLAALRHAIRDAFIAATEPWARKLSASGWRLPPEANEYYFQTVSASS